MIDFEELNRAYAEDRFYSLQLEVGDVCYQGCIYCYMNALPESRNMLSDKLVEKILDDTARLKFTAIEWLGGEPLLRKEIFRFMEKAQDLGLKNNMWTGGLPFADRNVVERTAGLCRNGLISIHVSTINPELYRVLHPGRPAEDLQVILNGVKHLLDTGYPADQVLNSVTFTGLQPADDMIETMEYFHTEFGIVSSLNVYHTYLRPGTGDAWLKQFIPAPSEVKKVYKKYISFMPGNVLPMNCVNKQYCSATLAVLNDGTVSPCATIRDGCREKAGDMSFAGIVEKNRDFLNFKYLKNPENLPEDCRLCPLNDACWGCRSRSYAAGLGLYGKDPRCFRKYHPKKERSNKNIS
ncbi:MAG TPA: radical SAM protein [Bacteroidetes bacterium]|nr:radical SAM protein [Bacteroidota bacterium]